MSENKEFKRVIVSGIAMYACVHKPKKGFTEEDIPAYCLDLVVDDDTAKILLNEGLRVAKVKVDEDTKKPKEYAEYPHRPVFAFRRKTLNKDGNEKKPLAVYDANNEPLPPSVLIGNGSKVNVAFSPWTVNVKGKQITGCELLGVQLIELVPYVAPEQRCPFEAVKGYSTPKSGEESPF